MPRERSWLSGFPHWRARRWWNRACANTKTLATGDFLIDRHPGFENVWLVGGGSGHGFKHGPAVGEHVCALIEGKGSVEHRFSLETKSRNRGGPCFEAGACERTGGNHRWYRAP